MPEASINALGRQKQAAGLANIHLGALYPKRGRAIVRAAAEGASGELTDHFPLVVGQTGSGTHYNLNANEIIANRANEILGQPLGAMDPLHPNDHVDLGQSSTDSFPTVMHIAAVSQLQDHLLSGLARLQAAPADREKAFAKIVKTGRTHLQDTTPLTLGEELSGHATQLQNSISRIEDTLPRLLSLAEGGTAVGTGLKSARDFDRRFSTELGKLTGRQFTVAPNKCGGTTSHDAIVEASGALNVVAVSLMKIANGIRLLASRPRTGIVEINLPANGPGFSTMPRQGKPDPGGLADDDLRRGNEQSHDNYLAGSNGHLQRNTFKPVMIFNLLQSIALLTDGTTSFAERCVDGITANDFRIADLLDKSLMLVTAITPHIGYDDAARFAKNAFAGELTLRDAAIPSGLVALVEFYRWVRPNDMLKPSSAGWRK